MRRPAAVCYACRRSRKNVDMATESIAQQAEPAEQIDEQMRFGSLIKRMDRLDDAAAERRCRDRAASCFGHLLRRIRVVDNSALADRIDDAIESGTFAEADREPLLLLDVVAWVPGCRGVRRNRGNRHSAGRGPCGASRKADRRTCPAGGGRVFHLPAVSVYRRGATGPSGDRRRAAMIGAGASPPPEASEARG